jgi:hypothetical protein
VAHLLASAPIPLVQPDLAALEVDGGVAHANAEDEGVRAVGDVDEQSSRWAMIANNHLTSVVATTTNFVDMILNCIIVDDGVKSNHNYEWDVTILK